MTVWWPRYRGRVEAEIVAAFLVGVAAFVIAAVVGNAARSHVPAALMGLLFIGAVLAVARFGGIVYAVPVGLVSLQAFDWYFLPPLRALDGATVFVLAVSILTAVLVAEVASRAGRRAAASEEARGVLSDEQAALRRVATLVAQGGPPAELFGAVAGEVGRLFATEFAGLIRYDGDDSLTVVAGWADSGERPAFPARWPLEGSGLADTIARTCRPARIDDYARESGPIPAFVRDELGVRCTVGSPIIVEARVWGALFVHSTQAEPLPADTEARLLNFSELVATAMANVQARAEVHRLAEEQAALRRVATLVARQARATEVFRKVAEEVARLLGVDTTRIQRYDADGQVTVVADWGNPDSAQQVGTRLPLGGRNLSSLVHEHGHPARIDDYANASGSLGSYARDLGIRSAVASPIVVEGRLWGVILAASRKSAPLPDRTELRIGEFTELVATAISNLQARFDLAASRARIVAATDDERRRLVRDLHDGAQQRLVHTVVTLKLAERALQDEGDGASALVDEALQQAQQATTEIRELAHGILPSVLTDGGLRAGVAALASRAPVPVENGVSVGRLPAAVEATAYFVVAEALTNVAKHAHAAHATVTARVEQDALRIDVRDDGVGGARLDGSGLLGLGDRLAVLDGRLRVESPVAGGTLVAATIPLNGQAPRSRSESERHYQEQ
ncbi:MAG: putative GAF-sensor signal transduction histidine kinase [Conexibacter sp.]|jgi:signal transduction histidine kinase|nr:putative GAF-sensor signal transduction histidine kinase [Conexibacter sp.]